MAVDKHETGKVCDGLAHHPHTEGWGVRQTQFLDTTKVVNTFGKYKLV